MLDDLASLDLLEAFALAPDRAAFARELVPGTEVGRLLQALAAEQAGDLDALEQLLDAWEEEHGEDDQLAAARTRLRLLRWERDPAAHRDAVRDELGLELHHQRQVEGAERSLPTRLDARALALEPWLARAVAASVNLDRVRDPALERVLDGELDWQRRRALLARLRRPTHPRLVDHVLADLEAQGGRFGAHTVHGLLTDAQLEQLARRRPQLLREREYVALRLARLLPGADVDLAHDLPARAAYLERVHAFVTGLEASFNALKACVLGARLALDLARGRPTDRDLLTAWLGLPRRAGWTRHELWRSTASVEFADAGGHDWSPVLRDREPPALDGEDLLERCLAPLLAGAADLRPWDAWVDRDWLTRRWATAKLLAGAPEPERWARLLGPAAFAALTERTDIELAPENPGRWPAAAPVRLEVDLKNVPALVVKVFELDAKNIYLATGREVDTTLDLDGLVPSEELTLAHEHPPLRRVRRTVELPSLTRPGTFVVELIGGGKSSRALVRKGGLRVVDRVAASGHALLVLDEEGRPLPDASAWLGDREYMADAGGEVRLPFAAAARRTPLVVCRGPLAALEVLAHRPEEYELAAGFHVERGALVRGAEAEVLVRAELRLHGAPAPLALLEEVKLTVATRDLHGTEARQTLPLALSPDGEATHRLRVPDDLAHVSLALEGVVELATTRARVPLSASRALALNGVDASEQFDALHLVRYHDAERGEDGWAVDLLGKAGEPRPDQALVLRFERPEVSDVVQATLRTDARGRVELGALEGISAVSARPPRGQEGRWALPRDRAAWPGALHLRAGDALVLPYPGRAREAGCPGRAVAVLLERAPSRRGYLRDLTDRVRLADGLLTVAGLEPGEYELALTEPGFEAVAQVQVARGEVRAGWICAGRRLLEATPRRALALDPPRVERDGAGERVRLVVRGAGPRTRLHVACARTAPAFDLHDGLSLPPRPGPRALEVDLPASAYVSGRDLGDEYRYVLERQRAPRRPGNLLPRPGLLLNPWAVQETRTDVEHAKEGGAYGRAGGAGARREARMQASPAAGAAGGGAFPNLDALPPAVLLANLRPTLLEGAPGGEGEGAVAELSLDRAALGPGTELVVLAVDPQAGQASRHAALSDPGAAPREVRLVAGLDPRAPVAQRKQCSAVLPGGALALADLATSRVEVQGALGQVLGLLVTLSDDVDDLSAWRWLADWAGFDEAEKRRRLSEHGCHELHVFLRWKDPEFFARVVAPHLRNKLHKTFLDRWLLEDDLTGWTRPFEHGRLNVAERALLADRLGPDAAAATARHLDDLLHGVPPEPRRDERLFEAALGGSSLSTEDALGIGGAIAQARMSAEVMAISDMALERGITMGGAAQKGMAMPMACPAPAPSMGPPGAPSAKMKKSAAPDRARRAKADEAEAEECADEAPCEPAPMEDAFAERERGGDDDDGRFVRDLAARADARPLYRRPRPTQELAETHYWRRRLEDTGPDLVGAVAFWRDWLRRDRGRPFVSPEVVHATSSLPDALLALAALDLPLVAEAPAARFEGGGMTLEARTPLLVFHEEIRPADVVAQDRTPVLVNQRLLRLDDRTRVVDGVAIDHPVDPAALRVQVPYVDQVVLTNPTSVPQRLDVLVQVPRGAVPIRSGFRTRSVRVVLHPFGSHSLEHCFYFPAPGRFAAFPAHVARDERVVARADFPAAVEVTDAPPEVDRGSWAWVSQHGALDDVLAYLAAHPVVGAADGALPDGARPLDLTLTCWRLRERDAWRRLTDALRARRAFDRAVWAYGLLHDDPDAMREVVLHDDDLTERLGVLEGRRLVVDPVALGRFEHLEYAPLINARAHRLGARRRILNDRLAEQWSSHLTQLALRGAPDGHAWLAHAIYLLLQDRVDEAADVLDRVDPAGVEARLQLDYLRAHLAFFGPDPEQARAVAQGRADYPVDRWRTPFREVLAQLDEARGTTGPGGPAAVDPRDAAQRQAALAATEPSLELTAADGRATIAYRNVARCRLDVYLMDVELLFSRQPFVQGDTTQFSFVVPNATLEVELPADGREVTLDLPEAARRRNALVEVRGGGVRRAQAHYANALVVEVIEPYGQVRVTGRADGRPLPSTYVKVYARRRGGRVAFYKDGYTDLRGRFDYASLSTNDLGDVERFALLVLHDAHGAAIREATPPVE